MREPSGAAEHPLAGKKILFLLGSLQLGGAERQVLLLARYLRATCGAEPHVWGFGEPGRMSMLCSEYGIPWEVMPIEVSRHLPGLIASLVRYARSVRRFGPDLLLPYTFFPNVIAGLVWHTSGARGCIWNQRDEGIGFTERPIQRVAAWLTPRFIANSTGGKTFLERALGVRPGVIAIIENGVELEPPRLDRSGWRLRFAADETRVVACMVANLSHYKDHATLLRAWRVLIDGRLPSRPLLLLAGILGDSYQSLRALCEELALGEHVLFLGSVDDVSGLLGSADLGVFSSRSEGCPNGVLECMASGLPLVASDVPAIRRVLGADADRQTFPPGDHVTLAATVAALLVDVDLRRTLGQANKVRAAQAFSPRAMCERVVSVMVDVLNRAPIPRDVAR